MSPVKSAYSQLEDVVGCKWSASVLRAIAEGVSRPGALERHVQGISTKVPSERLRKLTNYGLIDKHVYAEVPLRTEYSLTQNGRKLVSIIDQIKLLDDEIKSAEQVPPADAKRVAQAEPEVTQLAEYAGAFRSDELDTTYSIAMKDGALWLRHGWLEPVRLRAAYADAFETGEGRVVRFTRDSTGAVDGLTVYAGRVRHLRFDRQQRTP